jgi:DNA-binding NarL/FixJ family response regulator
MGGRSKQYDNGENKKKILIVDDDLLARQSLRKIVDHETNFIVCAEAEDIPQAIDAIDKQHFDLAIVDVSLPGTESVELTEKLKSRQPNLPVLTIPISGFLNE